MRDGTRQERPPARGNVLALVDRWLPEIYLLVALALTLPLCVLTAPFFTPDEANQSCRAISLGHGELIAHVGPDESGAEIDSGALRGMDAMNDIRMDWEKRSANFRDRRFGAVAEPLQQASAGVRWDGRKVFVPFGNTAVYPPILYAPAVLGWRLGEAANLTIFESLRLARLLSALASVALGWLALRICACSRWVLLPLLLLPSTLFLNASSSQDAVLLSVAALAAALLSRPLTAGREFTPAELVWMALAVALCGTARPPYVAMALVLFLPTLEAAGRMRRRWLPPAIAFTGALALCGLWRHLVAPLGIEWSDEANPETQGIFLLHHPLASAGAVIRGTAEAALDFAQRGVYVIGWNDLLPHHGAAAILEACLAAMLLLAPPCPLRTWRGRCLLALVVAGPLLGTSLAEYVIWTPPGFHTVYGIQPRYWLPLLPFATLLLQGRVRLPWLPNAARTGLLLAATSVLALVACTLPWMAAHAFYQDSVAHVLRMNLR